MNIPAPADLLATFLQTYRFNGAAILFAIVGLIASIGSIEIGFICLACGFGCVAAARREAWESEWRQWGAEEFQRLVDELADNQQGVTR